MCVRRASVFKFSGDISLPFYDLSIPYHGQYYFCGGHALVEYEGEPVGGGQFDIRYHISGFEELEAFDADGNPVTIPESVALPVVREYLNITRSEDIHDLALAAAFGD